MEEETDEATKSLADTVHLYRRIARVTGVPKCGLEGPGKRKTESKTDMKVKIIDFGQARLLSEAKKSMRPLPKAQFHQRFAVRFERFATTNGWEAVTWASSLCALLPGRALQVFSMLDNTEAQDYKAVKEALMKRYYLTEEGFRAKFRQSKPEEGESPGGFL
ncbi:Hypp6805 [Branchiostoma lanceolatum]|uniref:Hypp6805 protein n=1 Tax=Branchiostoma lanceolatum TaxID=7740 RepID=A0A8J9YVM8_BRALA|nr:Hypp6805 [Branchiostoma lanceolatum]